MKLVLATRNRGKQVEFQALLAPYRIEVAPMPAGLEVAEDGDTYLENATKKATAVARAADLFTIADDSGIEIDALNGAPGVQSARFLPGSTDDEKCARILEMIQGRTQRAAKFVIALVLADARRVHYAAQAEVTGEIAEQMRGTGGFGYDPIFIPSGHSKTMAELPASVKNTLSHRAKSIQALVRFLKYSEYVSV